MATAASANSKPSPQPQRSSITWPAATATSSCSATSTTPRTRPACGSGPGRQSRDSISVAYRDAWEAAHGAEPGHTFSARNPLVRAEEMVLDLGRRIDYVLVRCGIHGPILNVSQCERVLDEPVDGTGARDHFGLLARLVLPDHRPGTWMTG